MPIVLKSGSLKLLEHSGPAQACNGIALPFTSINNISGVSGINITAIAKICIQKKPVRLTPSSLIPLCSTTVKWTLDFFVAKILVANISLFFGTPNEGRNEDNTQSYYSLLRDFRLLVSHYKISHFVSKLY